MTAFSSLFSKTATHSPVRLRLFVWALSLSAAGLLLASCSFSGQEYKKRFPQGTAANASELNLREERPRLSSEEPEYEEPADTRQQEVSGAHSDNWGKEQVNGNPDLLECPALSGREGDWFVTHYADGQVNYSMEYSTEAHHSRWVCFSFTDETAQKNVKRTDEWGWDPAIPRIFETDQRDYSGYTRGHMVASNDRVFSYEANVQTFYYTNMSPQRSKHNTGVWKQLEDRVQKWGRNRRFRHVMYVVKGGTIREDQIEGRTKGGVVVPRYYWMAVLVEKEGKYKAIAFRTEHNRPASVDRLLSLAIPVDVLEKHTGLDLFHNLPDEIENQVEAAQPRQHVSEWPGIN